MNKMTKAEELSKIKHLMNFNLNEGKENPYSSVEYTNKGADGKTYGIIREGAKYYIKVSDKSGKLIKEDFDYVGGFMNRGENCYESYNKALKQFELKMIAIKENYSNSDAKIESWKPENKKLLNEADTEKMRDVIRRHQQIVENADKIYTVKEVGKKPTVEKQEKNLDLEGNDAPFVKGVNGNKTAQSSNIKKSFKDVVGNKGNKNKIEENDCVMDGECIDDAKRTRVGDGSPFSIETRKCCGKNRRKFQLKEDEEVIDGALESDYDEGDDEFDSDIESRLSNIEDMLSDLLQNEGIDEFEDDSLYDDDEDLDDEDLDDEDLDDDDLDDEDLDDEDLDDEDDMKMEGIRRRNARRINESDRNYFGKHPAYRKEPMEFEIYGDADGDLYDEPFGSKIGSGSPFEVDVDTLANAISSALKKK